MCSNPVRYDAVIVGAGPAGSSAARLLAEAGWDVALVEKAQFPRRKVCGEFLSATTMPVLEACGVADAYRAAAGPAVTRVGLYAGRAMLTAPEERHWGRALGREHLDVMLRDAAVDAGVTLFQPADVADVKREGQSSICILDDGRTIAAPVVIAACGSWNPKGPFAVGSRPAAPSDLFAFKAHFQDSDLPAGLMPLLAFPGGYGGLVHSDAGRTSLSCCIRRDALAGARARHGGKAAHAVLVHIMATTRGVHEALYRARLDGEFLSTGPIHPGIRARYADGIFFTGNIAGEAHPVIAEGISMAIQSSGLLAGLLIEGRAQEYAREWKRRFAPRIRAASLFAHLAMRDNARSASLAAIRVLPGLLSLGARLSGKVPVAA